MLIRDGVPLGKFGVVSMRPPGLVVCRPVAALSLDVGLRN